jgi:hypothetical protein
MKIDKKIIDLMNEGFNLEAIRKMSAKNIEFLHQSLINEQDKTDSVINIPNNPDAIRKARENKQSFSTYENKVKDGEMVEDKKKDKNPWAICTARLKKEFGTFDKSEMTTAQKSKFEKCVKGVKSNVKENMVDAFVEKEIDRLIEYHTRPTITKRDLLKHLQEEMAEPAIKPAKPITKPVIKPKTKPSEKDNPFSPEEYEDEKPRANTPAIKPVTPVKTPVKKPKIKPSEKDNPFSPEEYEEEKPRAKLNITPSMAKEAITKKLIDVLNARLS